MDGRKLQIVPAEENEANGDDAASMSSQSSHHHQKKKRKDGENYLRTSYARQQRAKTQASSGFPKGEDELVHSFRSSLMGFGGSPPMHMHPMPFGDPGGYAFPSQVLRLIPRPITTRRPWPI